ncbi:cellulose biosynthesis cyclic di-GMP-binding regulatory protein BcsB [Pseudochrobactrum sp. MP213Fo]|uniref:cellulose biosynthesis cyclic di-GMP-binding regulatory protein BcsB n=1 Tax=Pseudochrobactrum sp. MP213Fo TaxID=3022250 RepID=UPI003BA3526A
MTNYASSSHIFQRTLLATTVATCVITALPAFAQSRIEGDMQSVPQTPVTKPFDMAPEVGDVVQPATPAAPEMIVPETIHDVPVATENTQPWRRYIVPSDHLSLTGEQYQRSWNIRLTAQEASAPARLNLGYQSAILVAPENSYFTVSLNNIEILRQAVRSSDQVSEIMVDVPKDILKTGANTLTIRAQQRHRTDCSIESTYELWTNIDPAKTYLVFDLPAGNQAQSNKGFVSNQDISAIGVNAKGGTHFNIIAPGSGKGDNGASLLDLSQALAIISGMPNQSFSVDEFISPATLHRDGAHSGELTVLVGTHNELVTVFDALQIPQDEDDLKSLRFLSNAQTGEQFLLVSGETWREVEQNIAELVTMTEQPANTLRHSLQTQNWNLPDAQLLRNATVLSFAELGIQTQQFSGRRLRNAFTFGVPADFYANAYGSATVLLDAAYSAEVLPGSRIDIYVNDNIATTIPITSSGGGVMKQLPINVAMRNFHPGLNTVTIEAVLLTDADKTCAPGTSSSDMPRFALFDSSKFKMPAFGRIGQTPNLAATAGMAYPYNFSTDALQLYANLNDYNVLSASATVMGNLAKAAGRPLHIDHVHPEDGLKTGNTVFVGAITNLPDRVLAQTGINPKAKGIWSDDDIGKPEQANSNYTLSQWQEQLQSGWSGRLQNFYAAIRETFNISDGLRLFPGEDTLFIPSKSVTLLAAQGSSPSGAGAWTVVTAPDTVMLRNGMESLAQHNNWTKIDGRISTYNIEQQALETIAVQNMQFLATQPMSFTNLRLVATNWFSSNALSYVLVLLGALGLMGLSTSVMLSRFGRRDDEK